LAGGLLRWSAGTALLVSVLGGCSGGAPQAGGGDHQNAHSSSAPGSSSPGRTGRPAQPVGVITPERLQDALLTSFPGLTPITAPQNGSYDSLPAADVAGGTQPTPAGADIKPAKCRSVLWSGPGTKQFGKAAATVVAFRKPGDTSAGGVQAWEELVASSDQSRQAALGSGPVSGCGTVKVSHQDATLTFAEQRTPSLGQGTRGAVLTPSSRDSRRTSVVTFVGDGYVGVVFVQGAVTEAQVNDFASAAYRTAGRKLG
jgi:hypothetical protein